MVVDQWVLTVSQGEPGNNSQNAGTYWLEPAYHQPNEITLSHRAYMCDMQLYKTFGNINSNRRWIIGRGRQVILEDEILDREKTI